MCVSVWQRGHTNHFQFVQFLCQLVFAFLFVFQHSHFAHKFSLLCHFCLADSHAHKRYPHTCIRTYTHTHTLAHELGHAHTHMYVCTCMQSLLLDCTSGLFSYTAIDCSTMQLHTGMHTHIFRPIHIHIQEQYRVRRHIRPLCQAMDFYSDSGRMLK